MRELITGIAVLQIRHCPRAPRRQWPFRTMNEPQGVDHGRTAFHHFGLALRRERRLRITRNDRESQPARHELKDAARSGC